MCDTIVVTGEATIDGVTVFGKNSDWEPNEAHHVVSVPAADHPAGSTVRCTYIEIPQVEHTYGVLLCKPFWIWGAEMGVNEHGLAIGNEAIFSKVPARLDEALIGMDLLRLALERAATARQGVDVITDLLMRYGQGGNCGFSHRRSYHNSYLLADPHDAWVLETVGQHWAARRVHGVYTISNGITIGNEFDLASPDLVRFAVDTGWCKGRADFDFARCYSDRIYTTFSAARSRRQCAMDTLKRQQGQHNVFTVIAALRSHGSATRPDWSPDRGLTGATVCMHASFGPIRISQTTGSLVSHLHPLHPTHFVTATAAPCISIFKPLWLDAPLPSMGPEPTGTYDPDALFWQHEKLHRTVLRDYAARAQSFRGDRDIIEQEMVNRALAAASGGAEERATLAATCFSNAAAAEKRWLDRLAQQAIQKSQGWLHKQAWERFNRQAAIP